MDRNILQEMEATVGYTIALLDRILVLADNCGTASDEQAYDYLACVKHIWKRADALRKMLEEQAIDQHAPFDPDTPHTADVVGDRLDDLDEARERHHQLLCKHEEWYGQILFQFQTLEKKVLQQEIPRIDKIQQQIRSDLDLLTKWAVEIESSIHESMTKEEINAGFEQIRDRLKANAAAIARLQDQRIDLARTIADVKRKIR